MQGNKPSPTLSVSAASSAAARGSSRKRLSLLLGVLGVSLIIYAAFIGYPHWQSYQYNTMNVDDLAQTAIKNSDVNACVITGTRLLKAKNPQAAITPLRTCQDKIKAGTMQATKRQKAMVLGMLGQALALSNQLTEARPFIKEAIEADFDATPGHLAFALWLKGEGAEHIALHELDVVTQLDPQNATAWYLLSHIKNQTSDMEGGRKAALKAIAINPKEAEHWQELGDSYGLSGKFMEALPHYRKELELAPDSVAAQADVARSLALGASNQAEYDEAYQRITALINSKAVQLGPAYSLLGSLNLRFEKYPQARVALEEAVKHDETIPELYYNLAMARRLSGDTTGSKQAMNQFQEMEERFRRARRLQKRLRENPEDVAAHLALGRQWELYKTFDEALREYRAALTLEPGNALATKKIKELAKYDSPDVQMPRNRMLAQLLTENANVKMSEGPGRAASSDASQKP